MSCPKWAYRPECPTHVTLGTRALKKTKKILKNDEALLVTGVFCSSDRFFKHNKVAVGIKTPDVLDSVRLLLQMIKDFKFLLQN